MDDLTQRAQHLPIQDITHENRARLNVHGAETQATPPSISHTNISAERMSRSNSGIGTSLNIEGNEQLSEDHLQRQFNHQGQSGGEGLQAPDPSSLTTMNAPEHSQEAFLQYQQQYHQPMQGGIGQMQQAEQPAIRMPFPPPQPFAFAQPIQQYPAAGYSTHQLPLSQGSFSSPLSQNSGAGIHQADSSSPLGATPPDPYVPYGMPSGPPSIPSGSVPQSPTFLPPNLAPGQMPQIDSASYMYGYNAGPPGMMVRPPYSMSTSGVIGGGDQGQTGASTTMPYLMGGMNAVPGAQVMYNPNTSPPLASGMPFSSDRHQRRSSHISQGSFGASSPQQFGQKPPMWAASPTSPVGQNFVHGFTNVGGQSPNWSQATNMHRRMISNPYGNAMSPSLPFMPSSPPMFVRPTPPSSRGMHSRTPSSMSFGSSFSRMHMSENVARSPLLEEFRTRQNRNKKFELHDVIGAVVEFSSDQHGSRFIQEKLVSASHEDLQLIFDEIFPKSNALMTDVFGNYVIQKLIENGTDEMRSKLVESMRGQIHSLSLSTYGCRVVQRALDYVEPEEKLNIADELRDHIISCVRDQNANHVVQKILEQVTPTSQIDYIPQAFRGNVYSLAAHCYSCRVLQRIFEFCDQAQSRPLLEELLEDADRLMRDQYGNYVIQWILDKAGRSEKDRIIRLAKGNILRLSRHKFASNVVESIIAAASEEDRYLFIEEIMLEVPASELQSQTEGTGSSRQSAVHSAIPSSATALPFPIPDQATSPAERPIAAIVMMRDQYGNYVLQRFLELAEGQQKQKLVMLIKPVLNNLKRSTSVYTKHLSAIERLLDTTTIRNNAATMTNIPPHSNVGLPSFQ
ncbi:hypothetical protein L7F22_054012 [Adiantum nelumboides]|nr:hypothetical protein [Adiantum nelumboides]